jgi:hypothetical protein
MSACSPSKHLKTSPIFMKLGMNMKLMEDTQTPCVNFLWYIITLWQAHKLLTWNWHHCHILFRQMMYGNTPNYCHFQVLCSWTISWTVKLQCEDHRLPLRFTWILSSRMLHNVGWFPLTSVWNQPMLCNIPEDDRIQTELCTGKTLREKWG